MMKGPAKPISQLVHRMLELLRAAPIERLWNVARGYGPSGQRLTTGSNGNVLKMLDERFASKKALAKVLETPTVELVSAALPLLAGVDTKAAGKIFAKLVDADLSGFPDGSEEAALAYGVRAAWPLLGNTLSDDTMLALWKGGRMRPEALRPTAWARIPANEVAQMIAEQKVVIDYLPREATDHLPPDLLIELWLGGRIDPNKLPESARAQIGVVELEQAFRAEGRATGLADVAGSHPGLREPKTAAALLDRLASIARTLPIEDGGQSLRLSAGRLELCEVLIDRLGAARDAVGAGPLGRFLEVGEARLAGRILSALVAVDAGAARDAAMAILQRAGRGEVALCTAETLPLVHAVLALEPRRGALALAPFFTPEALSNEAGRNTASAILDVRAWGFRVERQLEPLFESDPGFLDLGVRLLDEPDLDARTFLASFEPAQVSAALVRAGWKPPKPKALAKVTVPRRPRWLERYKKGEHEAVWAEIRSAGSDEALLADAEKVALELMSRVRKNLERIVATLAASKYAFAAGSAKKALPAPTTKTAAVIKSLEKAIGASLPLTLRAFYEVVGEVNLAENVESLDDGIFGGFGRFDPLVIVPPKTAQVLDDVNALEARYPPELRAPFPRVYLGPDPRHKIDPETNDDRPYRLVLIGGPDGLVTRGHEEPFVDHLRRVVLAGGFGALGEVPANLRAKLTQGLVPL